MYIFILPDITHDYTSSIFISLFKPTTLNTMFKIIVCSFFQVLVSGGKAVGVEYVRNGDKRTVGAGREVVLTAGTVGTAHLLLRSGIGPRAQLAKHKVFSNNKKD